MEGPSNDPTTWQRMVAVTTSSLLWLSGALLLMTAIGHQLQHPGSMAFIGLVPAALALLPPTRGLISKGFRLTPPRTAMIILLGIFAMALDGWSEKEAEARAKGYASNAEMVRAALLGLATSTELAAHDKEVRAVEAEAERRRVEEAERTKRAAVETERLKEAECRADLKCWGEKHFVKATFACRPRIERLAKFQFEWTDGWLGTKFSHFRWNNQAKGHVTYVGDSIKFQNGFGAWQHVTYSCDYDPIAEVVLSVDAVAGRLPP